MESMNLFLYYMGTLRQKQHIYNIITMFIFTFRRRFMSASMLEMVIRCMMISEMRRSTLCHFPRATRAEYIPNGLRRYNLNPKEMSVTQNVHMYTVKSVFASVPGSIRARISPSCRWSVREVLTRIIHLPCDLSWYGPHLSPQRSHLTDRNTHMSISKISKKSKKICVLCR